MVKVAEGEAGECGPRLEQKTSKGNAKHPWISSGSREGLNSDAGPRASCPCQHLPEEDGAR